MSQARIVTTESRRCHKSMKKFSSTPDADDTSRPKIPSVDAVNMRRLERSRSGAWLTNKFQEDICKYTIPCSQTTIPEMTQGEPRCLYLGVRDNFTGYRAPLYKMLSCECI
jgi:hypothetical protein